MIGHKWIKHTIERYDHENPHAGYKTSHIARMIGEDVIKTKKALLKMEQKGKVKLRIKYDGTFFWHSI